MPSGSGIDAQIGFGAESTWGTAVAPTRFLEFLSEGLELRRDPVEGNGRRPGKRYKRGSRRVVTTRHVEGSVELEIPTKGFGLLLAHMLGSSATPVQDGATISYTQTHTPGDLLGKGLTVQKGVPRAGGTTVDALAYSGCKVSEWELACETGEIATASLEFMGKDETQPSLAAATYASGDSVFHFAQGTITLDAVPVLNITKASVKGSNPMKDDRYFFGNAGVMSEPVENDDRELTGEFEAEYTDPAIISTRFRNDTPFAMVLDFVGGVITGGFNYELKVTLPQCFFGEGSPKIDGADVIPQSGPFTVYDDGVSPPLTILYRSTDTTL